MRRQPPFDSPSWTRVFGPMDAMTRDDRLAPERTTTQFRATEFTQTIRDFDFAGAFAVGFVGGFAARTLGGAFADVRARGVAERASVRAGVRSGTREGVRTRAGSGWVSRGGAGAGAGVTGGSG